MALNLSPIIRECERCNIEYYILHTGQHYSFDMDRVFFEELNLPQARYNLDVGANVLVGADGEGIVEGVRKMVGSGGDWENPYGDGMCGKNVLSIILNEYEDGKS